MKRLLTVVLLGAMISGCGPKNPGPPPEGVTVNIYHAQITEEIIRWENAYETILISAGRAEELGLISDVSRVKSAGDKAYLAIEGAKKSLAKFIEEGGTKQPLISSLSALASTMTHFLIQYREGSEIIGEVR